MKHKSAVPEHIKLSVLVCLLIIVLFIYAIMITQALCPTMQTVVSLSIPEAARANTGNSIIPDISDKQGTASSGASVLANTRAEPGDQLADDSAINQQDIQGATAAVGPAVNGILVKGKFIVIEPEPAPTPEPEVPVKAEPPKPQKMSCDYCGAETHPWGMACPVKAVDNGAVGRWIIPDVGVDVAIYEGRDQAITDAADSANYFELGSMFVIGDHNDQGFSVIRNCSVGTIAYLHNGSTPQQYICTAVFQGHNSKKDLTDLDGNSVSDQNPGGITCYTCDGSDWRNVIIVFFQPA